MVEKSSKHALFNKPLHPYTQALLSSTPQLSPENRRTRIKLEGELPSPLSPPSGCAFHNRCMHVNQRCKEETPELHIVKDQLIACHAVEEKRI